MTNYFTTLTDSRQQSKVMHDFAETIMIVICAVIAGCDVWEDIADYCRVKESWFRERLGIKLENGIPSHDTMSRIFGMLKPDEFQASFIKWAQEACGKQSREILSLDGKTMRGSKNGETKPVHMVSAWANKARAVFGQLAVAEKSNEITAVPMLLELLDIEGTIITADAMSCQKDICRTIAEKGGDYTIGLKENQPTLCQATREQFETVLRNPTLYDPLAKITTVDKGHGRIETRTYFLCNDPDFIKLYQPEWKGLKGVGMMISKVEKDGKVTEEKHYHITSLTDVKEYAESARSHWGVESSLHWCLDVTFREDHSRMRADHSAENFCVVRHITLNILKTMDDKMSVARRRRHCAYDDAYLEKVISKLVHA
ncbi:MAG: ISAs1 family transposase [Clostridia bacterium]|nr:ISAs1 family transposase [Clostridia bacterium]